MMDAHEAAISVRQLTKTYKGRPPVEAVRGIDLRVPRGSCFGFLGPNGAGKTTTIEILEGLHSPTAGEVKILGMDWRTQAQRIRERIGVSLQETELSDRLTVLETLRLFRSFYRAGISAEQAMKWVLLEDKANSWIKKLSGGQKQRLAVATALVGNPELLFLDEPTTGLDPTNRRQLWDIIRGFKRQGRTVLLTTHYMDEAEMLCDQIAIIDQGKIIAEGTPRELINSLGASQFVEFSVSESDHVSEEELKQLDGVSFVQRESDSANDLFRLTVDEAHRVLPLLLQWIEQRDCELLQLSTRNATLEDVFVKLTGRHLNDAVDSSDPSQLPAKVN